MKIELTELERLAIATALAYTLKKLQKSKDIIETHIIHIDIPLEKEMVDVLQRVKYEKE